jgi:hypothetical protein
VPQRTVDLIKYSQGDLGNIGAPVPQRWDPDLGDIEAVVEVLTEATLLDHTA